MKDIEGGLVEMERLIAYMKRLFGQSKRGGQIRHPFRDSDAICYWHPDEAVFHLERPFSSKTMTLDRIDARELRNALSEFLREDVAVAVVTDVGTNKIIFKGNLNEANNVMHQCCGHGQTLRCDVRWESNAKCPKTGRSAAWDKPVLPPTYTYAT